MDRKTELKMNKYHERFNQIFIRILEGLAIGILSGSVVFYFSNGGIIGGLVAAMLVILTSVIYSLIVVGFDKS